MAAGFRGIFGRWFGGLSAPSSSPAQTLNYGIIQFTGIGINSRKLYSKYVNGASLSYNGLVTKLIKNTLFSNFTANYIFYNFNTNLLRIKSLIFLKNNFTYNGININLLKNFKVKIILGFYLYTSLNVVFKLITFKFATVNYNSFALNGFPIALTNYRRLYVNLRNYSISNLNTYIKYNKSLLILSINYNLLSNNIKLKYLTNFISLDRIYEVLNEDRLYYIKYEDRNIGIILEVRSNIIIYENRQNIIPPELSDDL